MPCLTGLDRDLQPQCEATHYAGGGLLWEPLGGVFVSFFQS